MAVLSFLAFSLLVGGIAATALPAAGAPLVLVEGGRAKSVLVLPDQASPAAVEGARILADHLLQVSGARVETLRESDLGDARVEGGRLLTAKPAVEAYILVGEGMLAKRLGVTAEGLGPGGMVLRTLPNALVLLGTDERTPSDPGGSRYAVTTFLEDVLGCRYLWPGELGKVVPKRRTIAVPELNVRVTPLLVQRKIRDLHHNDRLQAGLERLGFTKEDYERARAAAERTQSASSTWYGWHKLGGTLGFATGHAFGHLWEKCGKEHPEWFALQANGTRDQSRNGGRARLCKSNPGLIEAIAREQIERLNADPELPGVSLSPNDGSVNSFCMCEACKALDPPEARKITLWNYTPEGRKEFEYVSLTDRMVYFWNAIAERVTKVHPKALLGVDAYSAYSAPPVRHKLHPNLVVRFVPVSYLSDERRRQGLADWDAWAAAANRVFFRPNLLLAGRFEGTPVVYVHKMAEDFRTLAHHSMFATDFDSCAHNWATQGLNYYVLARLHWNPDADVDAMVDDYCRSGFGAARGEAKRYLLRIERLTDGIAAAEETDLTAPFTPEVLAELRGVLDAAAKAAGEDADARARVEFLRAGLEWTALQAEVYRLMAAQKENPEGADKAAAQRILDRRYLAMRRLFRQSYLAVNVAYLSWGEASRLRVVGWKGPSAETQKQAMDADEEGRPGER